MAQKQKSEKEVVLSAGSNAPVARRKPAAPRAKSTTRSKTEKPASAAKTSKPEMPAIPEKALPAPQPALQTVEPAFQEIAALAYSYWEARGCQGGSSEEDWFRAEGELRARLSPAL